MDYIFSTDGITDAVATMLANKTKELSPKEKEELMDGAFRGLAILEYPCIDIELNIWDTILYGEDDDKIIPEYFVCLKGLMDGEETWASEGTADWDVSVDFSATDWKEQLEADMNSALLGYADKHGYSLYEPNF